MSGNGQRLIAREGVPILIGLAILAVVSHILAGVYLSPVFLLVLLAGFYMFRDPLCEVPSAPLAILSPVSGHIESIELVEDTCLSRKAHRIRIRQGITDVHTLRSPIEGKVMNQWCSPETPVSGVREFQFWIKTDEDDDLLIAFSIPEKINFTQVSLISGERCGQGQRCGYMYVSGQVDVLVPENAKIQSRVGDRVSAGSMVLAQFVHANTSSSVN